ncbi:hypothetical protein BK735_22935 [Bacillus mycoides]|nr:hypothetical protein [Bacillus mycoides]TXR77612.1 hypothetical protein DN408_19145 [Bacillus sp. AR13-1]OOR17412.1 hypothetical protein BW891_17695 [Bacillus mycoides]OTY14238.1 hypothetical protein BK735_22935 [Bacillus mycoides]QWG76936.1 hypothetical protein EXW27_04525 [Bacillus mycoides]
MSSFKVVHFILYKTRKVSQMPVIQAFVTLFICYIIFYCKRGFHIFSRVFILFVSNVFPYYSQYNYNMLIPKQSAHILPKSGHDSANYFNLLIAFISLNNLTAAAIKNKLNFYLSIMLDLIVEHVMEVE